MDMIENVIQVNELDDIITEILKAGREVMRADSSSLWLIDKDKKELYLKVFLGKDNQIKKRISVKLGGIVGMVAETGEPVIINDPKSHPCYDPEINGNGGKESFCVACVPLKAVCEKEFFDQPGKSNQQKIIGVMMAHDRHDRPFNNDDLENLNAFARLTAVNIQKRIMYDKLRSMFFDTIMTLSEAIDSKHNFTRGHSRKVAEISSLIQELIHPDKRMKELILVAALLHDVGKLYSDDNIVKKPGKLNKDEYEHIKKHPVDSFKILESITHLKQMLPGILYHHERWDGKGYPRGLKGQEIPAMARIISVADAFDAMTSERPHRSKMSIDNAIDELKEHSGTQFDPDIIEVLILANESGLLNGGK